MTKKRARSPVAEAQHCIHHERGWIAHTELTRWVAAIEGRYCIVCLNWIGNRDRQKFLRYVRDALKQGKNEGEIAEALELDGTADPFAQPPRMYFALLLAKSKYRIDGSSLERTA